ncbi:MAG TPA: TonB-dependent receptor [Puia sp.]|nr:TonB-dependent receptor [Puia sp.]
MLTKTICTKLCLCSLFLLLFFCGRAQTIKGIVLDARTGEPMTGATVMVLEAGRQQFVKLDGYFTFKDLAAGDYEVEISYANYKKHSEHVTVTPPKAVELKIILEPAILELTAVTVTRGNASDRNTRNIEKHANQLVNVVSAKNIQLLPDITVANVLQRVSGVTIERNNSGEGRYPIIRGMEKRYINTLVNGIKIPSPDDKNRFIPLDLFPSELLERLEVSKSLTPAMEGDAIGGTVNLVMKDAPASKLFQVNASAGYNNIFNTQDYLKFSNSGIRKASPSEIHGNSYAAVPSDFPAGPLNYSRRSNPENEAFGLTLGNRFGNDKQLGLLFSGSYQNIFSGTQSTFFLPNAQPNLNNVPQFQDLYFRRYSTDNQRLGLTAKADYRIGSHNKLIWTNTYVRLNMFQTRQSFDTVALNSLVDESYRTTWQYQSIYNSTLQGIHQLSSSLTADWAVAYSIADNHIPDQGAFAHEYGIAIDANTKTVTKGTDYVSSMSRSWAHNSDKDWSASLNITKQARLLQRPFELKLGGLARDKKRDNFYNAWSLGPELPSNGNRQVYTNIDNAKWVFTGGNASPALNGNNYGFTEDVYAGYLQGKWQLLDKLELLGGLRVEHTEQRYNTVLGKEVPSRSGKIWYTDLLPSGQVKYDLTHNQALRLSYYKAIARPQFAELIPDGPDNFETFKQIGNPTGLKHSIADNFDLRYEWFPGNADQLLLGVFYKNIKDPIEYTAVKVGATAQDLIPQNIGNATNYGFEAVFTHYFGAFGISANYTYTQSRVTNDSMLYTFRNASGIVSSKYVSETRPLQGQSNHIGNLSVLYKSSRIGLDLQVAFTYTGERISLVSPYAGLHYWQQPFAGLDVSFEKKIVRGLSFYGKMNNLTNTPSTSSLHTPYNSYYANGGSRPLSLQTNPAHQIIVQKDYVRSSFLFGFRYKL